MAEEILPNRRSFWNLNLGHMLTILAAMGTGCATYGMLQAKVGDLSERVDRLERTQQGLEQSQQTAISLTPRLAQVEVSQASSQSSLVAWQASTTETLSRIREDIGELKGEISDRNNHRNP